MKTRLLLAVAGLAIGLAVPTFAQEQKAVAPEVRQQIEAVLMKLGEAMNKHDAAAAADLHTLNALKVLDFTTGTLSGRDAIEKDYAAYFATSPPEWVGKPGQMYAFGDEVVYMGDWAAGNFNGHSVLIFVRDADTWKVRMEYAIGSWTH